MSKNKNTQTAQTQTTATISKVENVEKHKHLTIANVFEQQAIIGGTKKVIAEKMVAILKKNGQEKTKKNILIEVAVKRQINAMLAEVGKRGRWKVFKKVGKDDQIKIEGPQITEKYQ